MPTTLLPRMPWFLTGFFILASRRLLKQSSGREALRRTPWTHCHELGRQTVQVISNKALFCSGNRALMPWSAEGHTGYVFPRCEGSVGAGEGNFLAYLRKLQENRLQRKQETTHQWNRCVKRSSVRACNRAIRHGQAQPLYLCVFFPYPRSV